ncbi:hypothetical protein BH10PSE3_BH10PSE3_38910 [soil metagenome]
MSRQVCDVVTEVTFDGNPPDAPQAYLGIRSCYKVGKYADPLPLHWGLGKCP